MTRVIVVGGTGYFGSLAVQMLRDRKIDSVVLSRKSGLDVNDPASIRSNLRKSDVVLDATDSFRSRTPALLDAAIEMGFDIVDLSDSLAYADLAIARAGQMKNIRVLTSCSSVSAISAAFLKLSGIDNAFRVTAFLIPASRYSAQPGAARSLLASVRQPIRTLRDGKLASVRGWSDPCSILLPPPFTKPFCGRLCESPDAALLPRSWPTLKTVNFYVDTRIPGMNALFTIPGLTWLWRLAMPMGLLARRWGSEWGCFGIDIEGPAGAHERHLVAGAEAGPRTAVAPAVLAVEGLLRGDYPPGFIAADRQVDPIKLLAYLQSLGIQHLRPA